MWIDWGRGRLRFVREWVRWVKRTVAWCVHTGVLGLGRRGGAIGVVYTRHEYLLSQNGAAESGDREGLEMKHSCECALSSNGMFVVEGNEDEQEKQIRALVLILDVATSLSPGLRRWGMRSRF